jgi:HK97 gp10 family phage protein
MATTTRQSITGLRELGENMKRLASDMQQRAARRATNAGAQVVKGAVIQKAGQQPTLADKPYTHEGVTYQPGEVARNVIVARIKNQETTSEHIVAVRSNKKNGYIGRIASFNEWGTVKMGKQPFMGPGFEQSKEAATTAIVKSLGQSIEAMTKANR